jgi:PIN domain nuclease of toxin-antitoxin system
VKAYVLDTHTFLWYVRGRRVGKAAARVLRQIDGGQGHAWIPAVVAVEIALLFERGRSRIGVAEVEATLQRNPELELLPLDFAQVKEFAFVPSLKDPFDRLIVAAARRLGCPIITADEGIAASGLVDVIWD